MKKQKFKFIFAAYGIFWIFLALIGVSLLFGMPQKYVKIASTVSSWSPTLALLLVFSKLNTGYDSRIGFIRSRFQGRAWLKSALFLFLIQTAIFFAASFLVGAVGNISCRNLFQVSPESFAVALISTALGGALGEELGWRGYLFWEQSKEYGILKGAVFNGIVWTLWHIPLWFIRGGSKWNLLLYIIAFSVTAICVSVTVGVFYSKSKHLMTAIAAHFALNFWVCFVGPDVPVPVILASMSVFYLLLAAFGVWYHRRRGKRGETIETNRLKLSVSSEKQMKEWIAAQSVDELKAAYSEMLSGALTHPEQWAWYAVWMIESKDGTHIGELCFKGLSDDGIAEIGYGIAEDHRGRGYATEAVNAAVAWALAQRTVNCVTAQADQDNIASVKVLEKCGFIRTGAFGEEGPIFACKKER